MCPGRGIEKLIKVGGQRQLVPWGQGRRKGGCPVVWTLQVKLQELSQLLEGIVIYIFETKVIYQNDTLIFYIKVTKLT